MMKIDKKKWFFWMHAMILLKGILNSRLVAHCSSFLKSKKELFLVVWQVFYYYFPTKNYYLVYTKLQLN